MLLILEPSTNRLFLQQSLQPQQLKTKLSFVCVSSKWNSSWSLAQHQKLNQKFETCLICYKWMNSFFLVMFPSKHVSYWILIFCCWERFFALPVLEIGIQNRQKKVAFLAFGYFLKEKNNENLLSTKGPTILQQKL